MEMVIWFLWSSATRMPKSTLWIEPFGHNSPTSQHYRMLIHIVLYDRSRSFHGQPIINRALYVSSSLGFCSNNISCRFAQLNCQARSSGRRLSGCLLHTSMSRSPTYLAVLSYDSSLLFFSKNNSIFVFWFEGRDRFDAIMNNKRTSN